jgi:hypothetical protein
MTHENYIKAVALAKKLILWIMLNRPEEAESLCELAINPKANIQEGHIKALQNIKLVNENGNVVDIYRNLIVEAHDENGQVLMEKLMSK